MTAIFPSGLPIPAIVHLSIPSPSMPRPPLIRNRIRLLLIALLLLLALQTCTTSIGWHWERVQHAGHTILSDDIDITSGGGGFCVKYFYSDESTTTFTRSIPPPPKKHSNFYATSQPTDPQGYGDEDFFVEKAIGFNYLVAPQSEYLIGVRMFWISYWHLAAFFCIVPLYRATRARFQPARPFPWQFRKRRRWLNQQIGLCPTCGYDLRATPHRCPECGAAPPQNARAPHALSN
jgi:hypothetical protein